MNKLIYLLTLLLAVGCAKEDAPVETALRPVYAVKVQAPDAQIVRSFSGRVTASESSQVAFLVGGRVVEVAARAGERYTAGDVLARLDATDYQTSLREAEARLTEARSSLRRTQNLFENGNASKGQLDSALTAESSARAGFDTAKKRVDDCTLVMPYDGVIGRVNINAQESVGAGQAVMSVLADGNGLEFEIGVPADVVNLVSGGMKGEIRIGAVAGEAFAATVNEIGAEPGDNTTYPVTLHFEERNASIREGMDGEVALTLQNPEGAVTTVPLACVTAAPGEGSFVYGLTANGMEAVVNRIGIETGGVRENGRIEILRGLEPGQLLVSRGVQQMEPGMRVLLKPELISE